MDYYEQKFRESGIIIRHLWRLLMMVVGFTLLLCVITLMSGCKPLQKVQVVERHTVDTLYRSMVQHDSIHVHDSVFVSSRGDTVMVERWHTKWKLQILNDTIYRTRHDTIPKPYEVVREKQLTWYQMAKLKYSEPIIGFFFFIIMLLIFFYRRRPR